MDRRETAEEPAAKRARTDPPATATPAAKPSLFPAFQQETGLFGSVKDTIGLSPATEPEVGISEYVDLEVPSFSGIIKHRFTDFLVYEVGLDGEVVRLKNITGPPRPPKPEKTEKTVSLAPAQHDVEQSIWNDASASSLSNLFTPEKLEDFKAFCLAGPPLKRGPAPAAGAPPAEFHSNVMESKETRTAVHKALRESFPGKFLSEMKEMENGDQVIRVIWNKSGGAGGVAKMDRKPKQERGDSVDTSKLPSYIHFTLEKTNKEMQDSLSSLCRNLHLQTRDMGTAGTKDKRAITVQRVSMKRGNRTIEDIWRVIRGGGGGRGGRGGRGRGRGGFGGGSGQGGLDWGVQVGDLEYKDFMFQLGMLKGNKFVITLRDIEADSPTTISRAMTTLQTRGFINYYGMQRFGTAAVPTHVIGLALLQGDWALAAQLILAPREGEGEDVAIARIVYHEGKIADAVRLMPRRAVAEKAILEHYHFQSTTDHLAAISKIPKNLRMMYVHAWQSYIWNRVVSERVRLFGCDKPIVGDLVYAEGQDDEGKEENDVGVETVESLDPDLEDRDVAVPSTSTSHVSGSNKSDLLGASKVAKVKVLTQEDIDSNKYTIYDIILPLPGFAVVYPEGKLGEVYREITKADKLDADDMFRKQKEYSLARSPRFSLTISALTPYPIFQQGGAYRKILHLPTSVSWGLYLSPSSTTDLHQCDSSVLLSQPFTPPTPYSPSEHTPLPAGSSIALKIELTLGSATYATMALREVLKTRTSSANQRVLTGRMEEKEEKAGLELEEVKREARRMVEEDQVTVLENVVREDVME